MEVFGDKVLAEEFYLGGFFHVGFFFWGGGISHEAGQISWAYLKSDPKKVFSTEGKE
jgi:hypothetical protein